MASIMPPIPRYFFLVIEPCLVTFGALQPFIAPDSIPKLLPPALSPPGRSTTPTELLQATQAGNMMLLFGMITLAIMLFAKDPRVVHAYVAASATSDFPHWAGILWVLSKAGCGLADFNDNACWTSDLRMLMLVPLGTFAIKVGYLMGLFGPDDVASDARSKKVQ